MSHIECIAIDDEPIALSIISNFCERKSGLTLSTFCEPEVGLNEILQKRPDLVFLDIEMNGLNGLVLPSLSLRSVASSSPQPIYNMPWKVSTSTPSTFSTSRFPMSVFQRQ